MAVALDGILIKLDQSAAHFFPGQRLFFLLLQQTPFSGVDLLGFNWAGLGLALILYLSRQQK